MPVLRKDFIIDEVQIVDSEMHGADCVLLIVACLEEKKLQFLLQMCKKLNLQALVEVHTLDEMHIALRNEAYLIGINNRNLKTLEVSINNTISIFENIKSHKGPIISESGIKNEDDVKYIYDKTGIKNFLIGESLLNSDNPAELIKRIIQINQ